MLTEDWDTKDKIKFLKRNGYRVTYKKHVWGDDHYGFTSGTIYEVYKGKKPFRVFNGHYYGEDSELTDACESVLMDKLKQL